MENIRTILAKNLLDLRMSKNLKKNDLAKHVGTTPASYGRWEDGSNWPDPSSLERIAAFYGIPSSRLFYDPGLDKKEISKTYVAPVSPKEITKRLQELLDLINQ